MPRHADGLPAPGDDSALAAQMTVPGTGKHVAPVHVNAQPDPPAGTPPTDAASAKQLTETNWVAVSDVGRFSAGQEIDQGHWSAARLRTLRDQGLIREKGD
jgi:hypothetical protein